MSGELPLAGISVFELGSNVAGPYGTWILAELGANVIKVERQGGDDARSWGPPFWQGIGTIFHSVNRNKQSIEVDLKDPREVQALRQRIFDEGDVLLQNLRPGAAKRLGLSAENFLPKKPELIYCNLTAFGAEGPMKDRPGYDALVQAFGGIISVTGQKGQAPARCGVSVIDMGTGMWCAMGILAALNRRNSTGRGGVVDTSLFETAMAWMTFYGLDYQVTGEVPQGRGTGIRGVVPYQAYSCSNGFLIIAAPNDRLFAKLSQTLGHPEWAEDDRFLNSPQRDRHHEELNKMIEAVVVRAPREEWQAKLDEAGIPNAPIQSIKEVLEHPQTEALGMAQSTEDPKVKLFGLPLSFDGIRPPLRNTAPSLKKNMHEKIDDGERN
ncbi:MAG: CoA transferase [SAR324 cluster bacterium]|nr:CoA transferase [SAR324 cluster bacterium]